VAPLKLASGSGNFDELPKTVVQCYEDMKASKPPRYHPDHVSKALRVKKVLDAVATIAEKAEIIKVTKANGDIRGLAEVLEDRAIARMLLEWPTEEATPKTLSQWKPMTPCALDNQIGHIASGKHGTGKNAVNVGVKKQTFRVKIETALSDNQIKTLKPRPNDRPRNAKKRKAK